MKILLIRLERPEREELSSYMYNIYNTLLNQDQWNGDPYVGALKNVYKNAKALSKSLKKMSTYIRKTIEKIMKEISYESLTENIIAYCDGDFIKEYSVLKREDITVKRNREIKMYTQYMGVHDIMDAFCKSQVERLNDYKDAKYTSDIAINILKLLKYVLGNNSDIMERELSVAVLGDTKLFEKSYKSRICSIIEEYGELELDLSVLDKKEKEKAILEEYQVFSNPSYIFFKGNVDIHYVDGNSISVTPDNPIAILSEAIARIEMIKVNSNRIVTVENLTSYNRINDNKSTFIYLSGYHNTAKQRFLKKIAENNSGVSWFHFGDIDPDGYYILKNLVEKTGIAFVPLYMDVQQLINCKQYCKPLEKNDMVKANSLLKFHFYDEVMEFMLANNCKLEQEIISWLYERD